ncbi:MAG: hypothetical protein AB7O96_04935 [Pseudobdellovibrionaceae bacterium]
MKTALFISIFFLSLIADANYCEDKAARAVEKKYRVHVVETRQLGGGCGEGGGQIEVWAKASDRSTYSVYFGGSCSCEWVKRIIRWGY